MFQEIKVLSETRSCFVFDDHIHFVEADMTKQWEFAGKVAKIVKANESVLDRMVQRAESDEDVQKFVEAQNLLNRIMSDAFWHATKAYNTREDCGLIHRFRLGDQAIEMMEKEAQ
jgi:hypothetical protein